MDGPLPKWCPAVALTRQDGHHSAVALLLKAALIQVSDYRLLGASGFLLFVSIYIYWCPTEFPYQMRLATGRWSSQGTPVSFTNKTDHHILTEILLEVALNTITLTLHIR